MYDPFLATEEVATGLTVLPQVQDAKRKLNLQKEVNSTQDASW